MHNRASQGQTLAQGTRHIGHQMIHHATEIGNANRPVYGLLFIAFLQAVNTGKKRQVLRHREVGVEGKTLRHITNVVTQAFGVINNTDAANPGIATG